MAVATVHEACFSQVDLVGVRELRGVDIRIWGKALTSCLQKGTALEEAVDFRVFGAFPNETRWVFQCFASVGWLKTNVFAGWTSAGLLVTCCVGKHQFWLSLAGFDVLRDR